MLDAKERREKIKNRLSVSGQPVTGSALAKDLGVSRQVIVSDIAILRAGGFPIYATPDGYITPVAVDQPEYLAVFACQHGRAELGQELEIIIDNGGKVVDVIVEHPVYGEIKANLMLSSRRQLAAFLNKLDASGAYPLSVVTGGVHLHTVSAPTQEILRQIEAELRTARILAGD